MLQWRQRDGCYSTSASTKFFSATRMTSYQSYGLVENFTATIKNAEGGLEEYERAP